MKQTRRFILFQNGNGTRSFICLIIGNADIQCLTLANHIGKGTHRLLQRCLRIRAVMIEDIDIIQIHALQACIQTGHQIFSGAPVSVRTWPEVIARLGRYQNLFPVRLQILQKDLSKIFLCHSDIRRTVIVCQIEMRDSQIKCLKNDLLLLG